VQNLERKISVRNLQLSAGKLQLSVFTSLIYDATGLHSATR